MKQLVENFKKLYPPYVSEVTSMCIEEKENQSKAHVTFDRLNIQGVDGFEISNQIIKAANSLYGKVTQEKLLKKDCDGIFLTEKDGKTYLFLCELKSKFTVSEIASAKDQIIGSYLKLHALLSLLQVYKQGEFEIRGIIASFSPTDEMLSFLSKEMENDQGAIRFCYQLNRDAFYQMPKEKCLGYYEPLCMKGITIHYIPIQNKSSEFTVQLVDLFEKERH
jgi:hypothetical protein